MSNGHIPVGGRNTDNSALQLQVAVTGDAAHVHQASASSASFAQSLNQLFTGTGVNDNDVLFTTTDISVYTRASLISSAGAVDVFGSLDGGVTYGATALSLNPETTTTPTTRIAATVAGQMVSIDLGKGLYTHLRVLQNGATAATAQLLVGG